MKFTLFSMNFTFFSMNCTFFHELYVSLHEFHDFFMNFMFFLWIFMFFSWISRFFHEFHGFFYEFHVFFHEFHVFFHQFHVFLTYSCTHGDSSPEQKKTLEIFSTRAHLPKMYTCDLQNPFFSVWTPKYVFLQFVGENSLRAKFPIRAKLLDDRKMELHFAFSHYVEKKNSGETWCNSGVIRCKSGETSRTTDFWAISS